VQLVAIFLVAVSMQQMSSRIHVPTLRPILRRLRRVRIMVDIVSCPIHVRGAINLAYLVVS